MRFKANAFQSKRVASGDSFEGIKPLSRVSGNRFLGFCSPSHVGAAAGESKPSKTIARSEPLHLGYPNHRKRAKTKRSRFLSNLSLPSQCAPHPCSVAAAKHQESAYLLRSPLFPYTNDAILLAADSVVLAHSSRCVLRGGVRVYVNYQYCL